MQDIQGETIEMYHVEGTDLNENPLCEWIISTNENKTIYLEIERIGTALEEINLRYIKSSGDVTELTSKELFQCDSTSYELNLESIKKFEIRVLLLNNSFNYNILIAQEGKDFSYPAVLTQFKALVENVGMFLVFLFLVMALTIAVFSLFKNHTPFFKTRMEKFKRRMKKFDLMNLKEIETVMGNMISGEYESLKISHT